MGEGYNGDLARCDKQIVDAGVGDLTPHILREVIYPPPTWQKMYNLQYCAAFGLSHELLQLAYFRPDVAPPSIQGLYFVGASTQPGNGVPLVLMGAKITGNRVIEDHHHDALSSSSH
jgi:phytoene dehydrogenase-like protein